MHIVKIPKTTVNNTINDANKRLTVGRSALRRKKALQDIQVMTSKLRPRAVSPQIRHINGVRNTRRVDIDLEQKVMCYVLLFLLK